MSKINTLVALFDYMLAMDHYQTMKKHMVSLVCSLFAVITLSSINLVPALAPIIQGPRHVVHGLVQDASLNWSGYAVETNLTQPQNNAATLVSGQWVVPAVTCTTLNTWSSVWVGLDGYSDNTVEQTGTEQDCHNGRATYYTWYELYPQASRQTTLAVRAGDVISAKVQYINNSNSYDLILMDQTSGRNFSIAKRASGALRQSAEWVVEAPSSFSGILPLSDFGSVSITRATATLNKHTGTISDALWQNDPITMVTTTDVAKATPSGLSSDGSSFNVVWGHN